MLHGLVRMLPSSTAVASTACRSRYADRAASDAIADRGRDDVVGDSSGLGELADEAAWVSPTSTADCLSCCLGESS